MTSENSETGPRLENIAEQADDLWSFQLHEGRGILRIGHDPPIEGAEPSFGRSLFCGEEPLYSMDTGCGTCEATLTHSGWPKFRAAEAAAKIRDRLAHVLQIDAELLEALTPLLGTMSSGNFVAALVDMDLQEIGEQDGELSWWKRRYRLRVSADEISDWDDEDWEDSEQYWWPRTRHYQLREPLRHEHPAYAFVFPSQSPEYDEARIAHFRSEIDQGRRPAALAFAWVEDRYVHAEFPERMMLSVLLDGHHKTAAYVAQGVPARILLLCRLEDAWDPEGDRGRSFRESIAGLPGNSPTAP